MSRVKALIVLVAAMSAVVLVGTAMPVVSQQPAERQTLTFFDPNKTNFERFINEGKRGISPGDTILFVDAQFDTETCEKAGQLIGNLQIIKNVGTENAIFDGGFTLILGDGKIVAGGASKFSDFAGDAPVFAVTGGTGAYRDVSGEISITEDVEMCEKKGALTTIDLGPQP